MIRITSVHYYPLQERLDSRKVLTDKAHLALPRPTGALGTARSDLLGAGKCPQKRDSGREALGDKTGLGEWAGGGKASFQAHQTE